MNRGQPQDRGPAGRAGEWRASGPAAPRLSEAANMDLGRVWLGVAARVWQRHPGPLERAAGRLLRSPGLARALLTTPSLLLPWLIASVGVLGVGALAAASTHEAVVQLIAPAVAAAAIAYAYGPGIDPAWELSRSMAVSTRMVLMVRAFAVFTLNALLGLAVCAVTGAVVAVTFGWLLPMTAMCALALAAATLARSANAGVAAGLGGWVITVLATQAADGSFTAAVTDSSLAVPYLVAAVCCAATATYATRASRGMS